MKETDDINIERYNLTEFSAKFLFHPYILYWTICGFTYYGEIRDSFVSFPFFDLLAVTLIKKITLRLSDW